MSLLLLFRPSSGGGPVLHEAACSLNIDFGLTVAAEVVDDTPSSQRLQVYRKKRKRKKKRGG